MRLDENRNGGSSVTKMEKDAPRMGGAVSTRKAAGSEETKIPQGGETK